MDYWREVRHSGGMSSVCLSHPLPVYLCVCIRERHRTGWIRAMNRVAGSSWHCSPISSCHEFESYICWCSPYIIYPAWVRDSRVSMIFVSPPTPIILLLLSPLEPKFPLQPCLLMSNPTMDSVAILSESGYFWCVLTWLGPLCPASPSPAP